MLTQERLKELLSYDSETGVFTRKTRSAHCVHVGDIAGTVTTLGYVVISVDGQLLLAHRLAWLYVYGELPSKGLETDHINGIRDDNRIANLRVVLPAVNNQNQHMARVTNKSGLLGVSPDGRRWKAQIGVNGKNYNLGRFSTPEEAHECYLIAKRNLHEGCAI